MILPLPDVLLHRTGRFAKTENRLRSNALDRDAVIRALSLVLAMFVIGCGPAYLVKRNALSAYSSYVYKEPAPREALGQLTATFLGVTTVLLSDGETFLMTDGFFTRPSKLQLVFGRIQTNLKIVRKSLRKARVVRLDAVMPLHSHHDHAMDAPEVARMTGAFLVGSESTANIGRGWGLPDSQIKVIRGPRETLTFGKFKVTWIEQVHAPMSPLIAYASGIGKTIDIPLKQPAPISAFKEGTSYSIHFEHPLGNVLIHGSAGFVPGALDGYSADVVFLGISRLAKRDRDDYFREVVENVGATRIIPIHWDDFTLPLDQGLVPMPAFIGNFAATMHFLATKVTALRRLILLPAWGVLPLYPTAINEC